jgi:hypothetical protein
MKRLNEVPSDLRVASENSERPAGKNSLYRAGLVSSKAAKCSL